MLPGLVLTAGLATRLRPLSLVRAKAALPVAGVPLAARVIGWLRRFGVDDLVLNLHHRPETLTRVIGDGSHLGVRVRYSWENPVLGSGGGPRHALPLLGGSPFVIVNGDTLTDLDLQALIGAHARSGALVTLALIPNPAPERYGGVLLQGDVITGFTRRGAGAENFHFIGVQVVERAAFERLPDGVPAESVGALYPALMRERPGSVRGFVSTASFDDIGTPADYFDTHWAVARRDGTAVATAPIAAPGVRGSILWDGVTVDAGAEVSDCILTDGVRVPAGCRLNRVLVFPAAAEVLGVTGQRRDNLLIVPF